MRIRWTIPAVDDLEGIKRWMEIHYPHLAEKTVRGIYERVLSLKRWPDRGRPGHMEGTRELVLAPLPYIVVYRIRGECVEILHIHHGAQSWIER